MKVGQKTLTDNNSSEHTDTQKELKETHRELQEVQRTASGLEEGQRLINGRLDHHDVRFDQIQGGINELQRLWTEFLRNRPFHDPREPQ